MKLQYAAPKRRVSSAATHAASRVGSIVVAPPSSPYLRNTAACTATASARPSRRCRQADRRPPVDGGCAVGHAGNSSRPVPRVGRLHYGRWRHRKVPAGQPILLAGQVVPGHLTTSADRWNHPGWPGCSERGTHCRLRFPSSQNTFARKEISWLAANQVSLYWTASLRYLGKPGQSCFSGFAAYSGLSSRKTLPASPSSGRSGRRSGPWQIGR